MMDPITKSFFYVINGDFFWSAMSLTSIVGMFVGAVIYNGNLKEIKKALISLASYATLIMFTGTARIAPTLDTISQDNLHQVFAGRMTVCLVTIFYFIGMFIGVAVTKIAHKGVKK